MATVQGVHACWFGCIENRGGAGRRLSAIEHRPADAALASRGHFGVAWVALSLSWR